MTRMTMSTGLQLSALRAANITRLPLFKNKHGHLAHSAPDGSDWTPAQWFQAMLGEMGEWAEVRRVYEQGGITDEEYRALAPKELADVQIYLDLLARRALDRVSPGYDPAQVLLDLVMYLGLYANARKKYERGDLNYEQYLEEVQRHLTRAQNTLVLLLSKAQRAPGANAMSTTFDPHPEGVDLGAATIEKFNEVSERVGCRIRLKPDDWDYHLESSKAR